MIDFKVSVRCMTYNQASYIVDALNGFCMQQTSFPYICCILDDASTDGEQNVIRKYLEDYFDLNDNSVVRNEETDDYVLTFAQHKNNRNCYFVVFYLKYNHYKIWDRKYQYISHWEHVTKYIAMCEGDDYWIDPRKLQKQVLFMESHPDYTMCFHSAKLKYEIQWKSSICCENIEDRDYSAIELFARWTVPTASMVFRKDVLKYKTIGNERILNGDIVLILKCCELGKVRGMADVMSVYRVQGNGVSHDKKRYNDRMEKYPAMYDFIMDNFTILPRRILKSKKAHRYFIQITRVYPLFSRKWFRAFFLMLKNDPFIAFKLMCKRM